MARTTPVHSGYTIINGSGTGTNGERIDVWVEYKIGTANIVGNYTPFTAYFYAALNPNYTSTTHANDGLNSTFKVGGVSGTTVSDNAYDFRDSTKVTLLGSYSGNITHNSNGTKTITISGSFTTSSSYISGGNISKSITLPTIKRGLAYINNGTSNYKYFVYIHNGSTWIRYIPYIHNGSTWQAYY